jgi:MSHA pilin protein MshA
MFKVQQRGFTLIELVVVIVILGILAAFAVPRFMGMEGEARAATIKSMGGTLMAAASMARAKCQAQGCGNALDIDGQPVTMVNGYPNNASIRFALQTTEGFTLSQANRRFTKVGGSNNCWVQYNQATAVNAPPTITYGGVTTEVPGTKQFNKTLSDACR